MAEGYNPPKGKVLREGIAQNEARAKHARLDLADRRDQVGPRTPEEQAKFKKRQQVDGGILGGNSNAARQREKKFGELPTWEKT